MSQRRFFGQYPDGKIEHKHTYMYPDERHLSLRCFVLRRPAMRIIMKALWSITEELILFCVVIVPKIPIHQICSNTLWHPFLEPRVPLTSEVTWKPKVLKIYPERQALRIFEIPRKSHAQTQQSKFKNYFGFTAHKF